MMKPEKYPWNEHERQLYMDNSITTPSPYKIKISDDVDKRNELEQILERLSQKGLAIWARKNAETFDGKISAFELRKAGFLANTLAQNSLNEISKFSSRVYAQTIAVGHMRGHAIVASDYAVKVINLLNNNSKIEAGNERIRQIELAKSVLSE